MSDSLTVLLNDRLVGHLNYLSNDRSIFSFAESWLEDPNRPTLSQYFRTATGGVRVDQNATQTKLSPWFSNLLPEGPLRKYLAERAHISELREFFLLKALGEDLPGAVRVLPKGKLGLPIDSPKETASQKSIEEEILRFSLAGVQLKFSALMDRQGGLTIPASGVGGDWIVKLPSGQFPAVPENEAAMLSLAARCGISVPEHKLMPIDQIRDLPSLGILAGKNALAVRRFDRKNDGTRIHIEDLAQVFGVYPDEKYKHVGFSTIGRMFGQVLGLEDAIEFVRRIAFITLTGNGDMHLKNWSLIYPDGVSPRLAPAYDLVSTLPYLPNDRLALNLAGEKDMKTVSFDSFRKFSEKAELSQNLVLNAVEQMVAAVRAHWSSVGKDTPLHEDIRLSIESHLHSSSLWREWGETN